MQDSRAPGSGRRLQTENMQNLVLVVFVLARASLPFRRSAWAGELAGRRRRDRTGKSPRRIPRKLGPEAVAFKRWSLFGVKLVLPQMAPLFLISETWLGRPAQGSGGRAQKERGKLALETGGHRGAARGPCPQLGGPQVPCEKGL